MVSVCLWVQVGAKQQSIECFGWKMLPGVCYANKAMDFEVHFKVTTQLDSYLPSDPKPQGEHLFRLWTMKQAIPSH